MSEAWYLIYTKARQEHIAELNLLRQNYTTYLPRCQVRKRIRGVYTRVTEPLFPRYLFVQLDKTNDNWSPLRSTRGVVSIVRFSACPAEIPQFLVEVVKARELQSFSKGINPPVFSVGEQVRVSDGVFRGCEGIFREISGVKRCRILLEIVGKKALLEISENDLERVYA